MRPRSSSTRSPGCRWASPSARTCGDPTARSPTQAAAGAQLVVIPNGSPYFAGRQGEREAHRGRPGRRGRRCPIAYVNQVGGQDELIFDGASFVVGRGGELVARAAQLREAVAVVDLDIPSDPRQRCEAPRRQRHRAHTLAPRARAGAGRDPTPPAGRRGLRRAGARHARLRHQERLHRRRVRPLGRHRLVAGGSDLRRRPRPRSRPRGVHAEPLLIRALPHRRRRSLRGLRHRAAHDRDRAGLRGVPRPAGPELRGDAGGPHRGEPAAPHPRHAPDGAVQQAPWLARGHHRQQERARRRLLHALRRHRRWLRGDQGRAEAARLRAVPPPQRGRRSPR